MPITITILKVVLFLNMVEEAFEVIYRITKKRDYVIRWEDKAITSFIVVIIDMLLLLGLMFGW